MNMSIYFGMFSSRYLAVFEDYEEVKSARALDKNIIIQSFYSINEALRWVVNGYNSLQDEDNNCFLINYCDLKLNHLYTQRDLKKMYEENYQ